MNHRFLVSVTVSTILVAFVLLTTSPVAGQAPSAPSPAPKTNRAAAKAYTPPRTPDGQPDLQGFWTNSTYVPLERADGVTKEFYTPEEAGEAIKRAAEREAEQTEPGTTADVHYDFSQFGLDRSQSTFAQNLRTSLIVDPPNGKVPSLTPAGQKRAADRAAARKAMGGPYDAVENMPIGSRCIIMAGAGPPMMNAGYNANYQIVQGPGYVMILTEMIHDVRIIPLDPFDPSTLREPQGRPEQDRGTTSSGSPRAASRGDKLRVDGERSRTVDGRQQPSQGLRQWTGVSRGRWEGNTLVVETTNFNGKNPFRGASENMRVEERFTRVADDAIQYRFTIEDESTWARPWTAEVPMAKTEGPIFEFACHETNYGIANILAGARADEKKAAEQGVKKGSN